jgi:hypothetical protein
MSAILSGRQAAVLARIGDLMCPAGEGFPAFSETGCIAHVDPILEATLPGDVAGLKILLSVLSFFPSGLLAGFLRLVQKDPGDRGLLAGPFRNIALGLKGLVMSTYYSNRTGEGYGGPRVHEAIDFEIRTVKP